MNLSLSLSTFHLSPFHVSPFKRNFTMKYFRIACCLCALIVLSASAAGAGESAPVLTLDKAVSLALEKSPMLNSAKLGVNEAGHRQEAARADFFPKLSTDYSYTKLDQPPEMRFVSTQNSALQSLVTGNKVEVGPGKALQIPRRTGPAAFYRRCSVQPVPAGAAWR